MNERPRRRASSHGEALLDFRVIYDRQYPSAAKGVRDVAQLRRGLKTRPFQSTKFARVLVSATALLALPDRAQINAQLFAFLVQVTALEVQRLGGVGDVELIAF